MPEQHIHRVECKTKVRIVAHQRRWHRASRVEPQHREYHCHPIGYQPHSSHRWRYAHAILIGYLQLPFLKHRIKSALLLLSQRKFHFIIQCFQSAIQGIKLTAQCAIILIVRHRPPCKNIVPLHFQFSTIHDKSRKQSIFGIWYQVAYLSWRASQHHR